MDNINISQQFDEQQYSEDDVHYATFSGLAAGSDRDMRPHWHDRFFQLHYLTSGKLTLQMDTHYYSLQAPLVVLTPPLVPHAFSTGQGRDGHVLTVRQELVWPLMQAIRPGSRESVDIPGFCLSMASRPQTRVACDRIWALMVHEFTHRLSGRQMQLRLLAQSLFTLVLREADLHDSDNVSVRGEMRLFQRFNQLVNEKYRNHSTVPDYARELGISESRLNQLCQRLAGLSPKRLIFERVMREARRMLLFSSASVHQIARQLGYNDPAYFARFFHRLEGRSPSEYRRQLLTAGRAEPPAGDDGVPVCRDDRSGDGEPLLPGG